MTNLLAQYKNGNYEVKLYSDGTKIKQTSDDYFQAEFPTEYLFLPDSFLLHVHLHQRYAYESLSWHFLQT